MPKHMTLDDRIIISNGLNSGLSFSQIGKQLGKATSTISREVRNRRKASDKGAYGRIRNRCIHRTSCTLYDVCPTCAKKDHPLCRHCNLCNQYCSEFKEEQCEKLNAPPYVCNGCKDLHSCTLRKFFYNHADAHNEYRTVLVESREGFNLTAREIQEIDILVSPLLKKGQSVHHIVIHHKNEISVSEQTIERLIDADALSFKSAEQRRHYKIKPRKAKQREVQVDRKCRLNRTIKDFQRFTELHPELSPVQMDTVIGVPGGKCLFTMVFTNCGLMLAFLCEHNTAACILSKIEFLYDGFGSRDFCTLFPVLLTDNGSEFSQPAALELDKNGVRRTNVFYCDAYASYQKGIIERNHEFIRLVLPKGTSFDSLSQDNINLLLSHINSYSRPAFRDKSPFDMFAFLFGNDMLDKLLNSCHLSIIPSDDIILTPALFDNFNTTD